jgi:hypothetical protein
VRILLTPVSDCLGQIDHVADILRDEGELWASTSSSNAAS